LFVFDLCLPRAGNLQKYSFFRRNLDFSVKACKSAVIFLDLGQFEQIGPKSLHFCRHSRQNGHSPAK
ncbi:hypothetical protein, partial [Paenibacillus sp. oral taxon 786]|uniref:hypothetical protein n=1 Tax=Paenibacillus sp. oral taxon 786 TaxID=652715 RepID=UPI00056A435C